MDTQLGTAQSRLANTSAEGPIGVLYIIDQLCEMGGAERVLLNMVASLPPARFTCRVLTFKIDPSLPVFSNFPCPLHVIPLTRTYNADGLRAAAKIRRLVRDHQIRITHTFFETSDLWAGPIAKMSGCPVLISSRRDMGILRSGMHRLAYRLLSPVFDQVQTVSEQVRQCCIEQDRIDPRKVRTVYNGVNLNRPAIEDDGALARRLGIDRASHVITNVAHIRKIKGIDVFLRAAARVRQEFPRALFLVVGEPHDPDHYSELCAMVESLNLAECVRFVGGVEDVYSILKLSDVFCMLSRSEGMSNAVLEAMACSLPCVTTRVGGNPELVHDMVNGYLVDSDDAAAGADRLLRLMRNRTEAQSMGRRSRLLMEERFTTEQMVDTLVRCYDSLIGQELI